MRVMPVGSTVGVCVLYVAFTGAILCCLDKLLRYLSCKLTIGLMVLSVIALAGLQLHFDPYTLQVDRWSAIHNFLDYLLHGEYPYAAQTHLGGYGSPFPVWQILHLPFFLLGNVGLSFVVCLLFYTDSLRRLYDLRTSAFAFTMLLLSPAFLYEVCVRSDLMSNFLCCAAIIQYLKHYNIRFLHHWVLLAIICGLMLSTRLSVAIPFIIYYFEEFLHAGIKRIVAFPLLTMFVFALTFLTFAIWNWNELFFFRYNPFELQTRQGLIINDIFIIEVSLITAWLRCGKWHIYLMATSGCLLALVALNFVSKMYIYDCWGELFGSSFDITYFNMAMPFVVTAIAHRKNTALAI